ncbi:MAG: hypothetical protein AAF467_03485 [Actinomycetota bacterium]
MGRESNPLSRWALRALLPRPTDDVRREEGFEIAQSMGIALLGLVIAATFASLLTDVGNDVITQIRSQLGLG